MSDELPHAELDARAHRRGARGFTAIAGALEVLARGPIRGALEAHPAVARVAWETSADQRAGVSFGDVAIACLRVAGEVKAIVGESAICAQGRELVDREEMRGAE